MAAGQAMTDTDQHDSDEPPLRIAVSACLLGEAVRYNGGHKRDRYLTDTLARHFQFVALCPEVAIGLGVPRPTIRLQGSDEAGTRAISADPAHGDVTAALAACGREAAAGLAGVSGYIFKSGSPSCGLHRVKRYGPDGVPNGQARGIYAEAVTRALPLLPCEEEGRLNDPDLRDCFIDKVFAYHRWQQLGGEAMRAAALVAFHTEHKFLLMSHGQAAMRALGRLVADAGQDTGAIAGRYITLALATLSRPAPRGERANALQHAAGWFRRRLDGPDRQELAEVIDAYRLGELPLIAPLTLIRHHLRRHPDAFLQRQRLLGKRPPVSGR